jgi:hypothetical protein
MNPILVCFAVICATSGYWSRSVYCSTTGRPGFSSGFKKEIAMADKIEVCMCEKCGNEAEMTISCQWVDVQAPSGETQKKQKETRTCKVCGNEADMIIDFGD